MREILTYVKSTSKGVYIHLPNVKKNLFVSFENHMNPAMFKSDPTS